MDYMWDSIWTKDKILFLIERFIYIKLKERKNADTGKVKKTKELIFPRFHQLRAVERVMEDVMVNHTSCNYLIEHSAGSGKTETISWLSHILATVHDSANENIFDTVLVITDRIIVDRQLQEAILGIEHKSGQVKVMDDKCSSEDLAIALGGNTKIIMVIDIVGTWCIGIPLCLLAAYVFNWGIVGVYTLLTTEEIFRLVVSLIIFKKRKWMISLS